MSRVDSILAVIDGGLQTSGDQSYGESGSGAPRCWRCLMARVEAAESVCDACREWMCGDADVDPISVLDGLSATDAAMWIGMHVHRSQQQIVAERFATMSAAQQIAAILDEVDWPEELR